MHVFMDYKHRQAYKWKLRKKLTDDNTKQVCDSTLRLQSTSTGTPDLQVEPVPSTVTVNPSMKAIQLAICNLLALDGTVYVTNEEQRSMETNRAKHQEEAIADASHVSKEE